MRLVYCSSGLDLTSRELSKLWGTFALAPDGLYTWSKFCQRYTSDTNILKKASNSEELRIDTPLRESAEQVLSETTHKLNSSFSLT